MALAALALSSQLVSAAPYASQIQNISYSPSDSIMQFFLNESGGNVWITYEDGSTNANFNGVTTGKNLPSGPYTFDVPFPHTSYTISVYKVGTGSPFLVQSSPGFTPRGVDVNKNFTSTNFGRVYVSHYDGSGVEAFNPDMTSAIAPPGYTAYSSSNCVWFGGGFSPYRIFVAADDSVMVGDASWTYGSGVTGALQNDGVWRLSPDLSSAQLFLGPRGEANGTAGVGFGPIHSTIQARPVVIGNPSTGPVTLVTVDGDYSGWANGYNSLLVYKNIDPSALPYQGVPDIQGPAVGLNISDQSLGGNAYPGLQFYGNYIYAGTYRENYGFPSVQVYTNDIGNGDTLAHVWDSITGIGGVINSGPDVFRITVGGLTHGTVDLAISPDGRFCVAQSYDNWFVIAYMTNGIPDASRVFNNIPTSYTSIARGIAFDAAGNIYSSSSGIGNVQEWSPGLTATSITTGTTNGSTGFNVVSPSTLVKAVATTPKASQGGSNGSAGTPVPGVFTITRAGDLGSPLSVSFTLSGTATSGVYTASAGVTVPTSTTQPTTNTVVIPAGQASTTVTITPTTANVPRPTTSVFLQLLAGSDYNTTLPFSGTVLIQNTSSNLLMVSAAAPTMYKAFSNDTATLTITRWGDTNVSYTINASAFSYAGTLIPNTDFKPTGNITMSKANLTKTVTFKPLANGAPAVDAYPSPYGYTGNKSTTVTLAGSASYGVLSTANSTVLTLLDNADPSAPVLYSNPLTDSADASNWHITYGTGDELDQGDNYTVEFGYDLTTNNPEAANNDPNGIPLPPSGSTSALRITCNKNYSTTYGGGVNVYLTSQTFSGNYAVRFNMNLIEGFGSFQVEGAMFGINHDGTQTNWWLGNGSPINGSGPWASDGIWYWVQAPPGGAGGFGFNEFQEYTGNGAPPNSGWTQLAVDNAMTGVFKHAVFTAAGALSGGTPANNSTYASAPNDTNWCDVEIKQINGVVTMSIDKTPLFVYTNTSGFESGKIMLGYDAPIEGAFQQYVNSTDAAAYFSNLRVVQLLPTVVINSINISGGNVVLDFVTTDGTSSTPVDFGDTPGSFAIQTSAGLSGFADGSASITQVAPGSFEATLPYAGGATQFYRVHHL